MANEPTEAICPKCGKADRTGKVSILVSIRDRQDDQVAESKDLVRDELPVPNGSLRRKLAQPRQPQLNSPVNIAGFIYLVLCFVSIMGAVAGYLKGVRTDDSWWTTVFYTSMLLTAVFLWLAIRSTRRYMHDLTSFKDRTENKLKAWQESLQIWDRMYYCFRDDCAFDPETKTTVDSSDFHSFLRKAGEQA